MRPLRLTTTLLVLLILAACGARNSQPQNPITIEGAWLRPALENGTTAAYLDITNHTDNPITLTAITADFADMVQIHQTVVENDMAQMQHLERGLRIGAGETIRLQPGGYHIMLLNMRQNLDEGTTIPIAFAFDNGETTIVEARVSNLAPAELE